MRSRESPDHCLSGSRRMRRINQNMQPIAARQLQTRAIRSVWSSGSDAAVLARQTTTTMTDRRRLVFDMEIYNMFASRLAMLCSTPCYVALPRTLLTRCTPSVRLYVRLSVLCTPLTLKQKTTAFKRRGDVTHIRSNCQSYFKGELYIMSACAALTL